MSLFIVLSLRLTRLMNESIESALIPVPLCLAVCRIVSHMSPGRWWSWIGGVFSVNVRWGTGGE